jgi:hypothetical protein
VPETRIDGGMTSEVLVAHVVVKNGGRRQNGSDCGHGHTLPVRSLELRDPLACGGSACPSNQGEARSRHSARGRSPLLQVSRDMRPTDGGTRSARITQKSRHFVATHIDRR